MQKNTVSLSLAGKKFSVPCEADEAPDVLLAAEAVNVALAKAQGAQSLEIRLLMLALNLSYELLQSDRFSKSLEADIASAVRQVQRILEEQKTDQEFN